MKLRPALCVFATLFSVMLGGCDIPGLGPDPRALARESDGKATGGACRYALRGIEDCYILNEKASRTAIFTGWKEMDQYMRENKIEGVPTKVEKPKPADEEIIDEKPEKPAPKGAGADKAAATGATGSKSPSGKPGSATSPGAAGKPTGMKAPIKSVETPAGRALP